MTDQPIGQLNMQEVDPLHGNRFFVRKRDGRREEFNEARIHLALEGAFRSTLGIEPNEPLREVVHVEIRNIADPVVQRVLSRAVKGEELDVETIQDLVEEQLMRAGHLAIARRYIIYRDERRRARVARAGAGATKTVAAAAAQEPVEESPEGPPPRTVRAAKTSSGVESITEWAALACESLERGGSIEQIIAERLRRPKFGEETGDLEKALIEAAKSRMTREPGSEKAAARVLARKIYCQALLKASTPEEIAEAHRRQFRAAMEAGVDSGQLDAKLLDYELETLAQGLRVERDGGFGYFGLLKLFDDYLLRDNGHCTETPQFFWMRVAMGLALNETQNREARALEFYDALSTFRFIPSAAVLLNSGAVYPLLAECYQASGWSDLEHITAQTGGRVKPRKGLTCAWLEAWHAGIPDFLTYPRPGDDAWDQDLSKGIWIPDLFMKRVRENGQWTLFDSSYAPDLHHCYGKLFERLYLEYEQRADRGELRFSRLPAAAVWSEMLASMSHTGQPWLAFKDTINVRCAKETGSVIQSGNLCGDILLPGSPERASACVAGAINLAAHLAENQLDCASLRRTVETAVRMLDNALEVGVYPEAAFKNAAMEKRPIALGIAGFQDFLHRLRLSYASPAAVEWADRSTETVSFMAVLASCALAAERGKFAAFEKSKWNYGLLPFDTLAVLEHERGAPLEIDRSSREDWMAARAAIRANGIRNSTITAIAPLEEGAVIAGITPSIDPSRNVSPIVSDFAQQTQWNPFLVEDLKAAQLWNDELIGELQESQGSIQRSKMVPVSLKEIYRTAHEIAPRWLVECASRRQKWLDMSQALTLCVDEGDPALMSEIYLLAWEKGVKTTRQLPATPAAIAAAGARNHPGAEAQRGGESEAFPDLIDLGKIPAIVT